MKEMSGKKKCILEMVMIMLAALLPLMICSKSSPLYPFNDWPDANIFMTIGKGMVKGEVCYVDLFDHKGPYIYAVAAISYLIAPKTFYGYFIFEVLSYFFFLYYSRKIIGIYTKEPGLWVLPLISVAVAASKSFVHGGSLEELSLGIMAYAIYSLLVFLRNGNEVMSSKCLFFNGIWAGILLWSKYTLLGLYATWFGIVILVYFFRKRYREILKAVGIFGEAVLFTTIPWVIYFAWNHALKDWLLVYIWNNITGYAAISDTSILQKIINAVLNAMSSLKDVGNRLYSLPLAGGCLIYVFNRKVSWKEKISVFFMGLGLAIGIFIGETKHDYYGLPLAVFTLFGGLAAMQIWEFILSRCRDRKNSNILRLGAFVIALCAAVGCSYVFSPNTYLMSVEREEMPQYRFAEIIEASEDTTLLNYAFLDGGFYTVLDQTPNMKEFCVTNMNRLKTLEIQNEYLERQLTNWVITWKAYEVTQEELQQLPILTQYYDLVDYQYFYFEGDERTYALYKRK